MCVSASLATEEVTKKGDKSEVGKSSENIGSISRNPEIYSLYYKLGMHCRKEIVTCSHIFLCFPSCALCMWLESGNYTNGIAFEILRRARILRFGMRM